MSKRTTPCPTCGNEVDWAERPPWRPFCSERCRLIDLGAWMDGSYRLPTEEQPGPSDDTEENPGSSDERQ